MARLVGSRLEGTGIEVTVIHTQRVDPQIVAGAPAVGPCRLDLGIVNAEVDVAPVGLVRGHAGVVLDAEVEPAAAVGIVLADNIAEHVVEHLRGMHPHRDRKITGTQAQRVARSHLDGSGATIELRRTRRPAVRPRRGEVGATIAAMVAVPGNVLRIAGQRPMPDKSRTLYNHALHSIPTISPVNLTLAAIPVPPHGGGTIGGLASHPLPVPLHCVGTIGAWSHPRAAAVPPARAVRALPGIMQRSATQIPSALRRTYDS